MIYSFNTNIVKDHVLKVDKIYLSWLNLYDENSDFFNVFQSVFMILIFFQLRYYCRS